jgi:hypothetical protein
MYVSRALDLAHPGTLGCNISQNVVERRTHIAQRSSNRSRLFLAVSDLNDCLAADPLHFPAENPVILIFLDLFDVGRNDLKLEAGTSRIHDEHVHEMISGTAEQRRAVYSKISSGGIRGKQTNPKSPANL